MALRVTTRNCTLHILETLVETTTDERVRALLDTEILRHDALVKRGMNNANEREALQEFRQRAYGSRLELPKATGKYEGCQTIRF